MRLRQTLVPRSRPAPDGRKSGGSQPTDISVINRRLLLAPPLPMTQVNGIQKMGKNRNRLLTSEVISTPGLTCEQPPRKTLAPRKALIRLLIRLKTLLGQEISSYSLDTVHHLS